MNEDRSPVICSLRGKEARKLAECFDWPSKQPVFEFFNEVGNLFISYDSGLDYQKDGRTFEWESRITNPFKAENEVSDAKRSDH